MLDKHRVMVVQGRRGLLFWPYERVALIMDQGTGRLTIVARDGAVAHRPGPLDAWRQDDDWRSMKDGVLANPACCARDGAHLVAAGEWRFPAPDWVPQPPAQPETGSILYVGKRGGATVLGRDDGEHALSQDVQPIVETHPHMVKAGRWHVNLRRLNRVYLDGASWRLGFDNTASVTIAFESGADFARRLELPDRYRLHPATEQHQKMYRLGLRDWPQELLHMPQDALQRHVDGDEDFLDVNIIWQVPRLHAAGLAADYGRTPRGLWYRPTEPILARAGCIRQAEALGYNIYAYKNPHYDRFVRMLGDLVGEHRLLTYHDLGFEDAAAEARGIGQRRGHLLLVTEKDSLEKYAREVAARYASSWCVLSGAPTLYQVEYLAADLLRAGHERVTIVAYVDFDPSGWSIPEALSAQLARYGVTVDGIVFLVKASRFSKDEIEMYGIPLQAATASDRTKIIAWVRASGGIDGKGIGLHADHLRPVERVFAAFEEETGLKP